MFKINYRITTNIDYIKALDAKTFNSSSDIEGFICLHFNSNEYGYCHNCPLGDNETGWDLLTIWFNSLLNTIITLNTSSYVAINDIESYNSWLEFRLYQKTLKVSIVKAEKSKGVFYLSTSPLQDYSYGDWKNVSVDFGEFKNEIITKSNEYLEELSIINLKLLTSDRLLELKDSIIKASL